MEAVALLLGPTIAVIASHLLTRNKLQKIHILVNSRLEEALAHIEELKSTLEDERASKEAGG